MKKLLFSRHCRRCAADRGPGHAWSLKSGGALQGHHDQGDLLDRPGYAAAIKLLPQFEQETEDQGRIRDPAYENTREREVLISRRSVR